MTSLGRVVTEDLRKVYTVNRRTGLLSRRRERIEALRGISLDIGPAEVFGILGPNGAGKTTLIRCLTTLLLPSSGRAWVNGHSVTSDARQVRSTVGCMLSGERGAYPRLTGRENLAFFAALHHVAPARRSARVAELLERFGLAEIADRLVETYSTGQRARLGIAKALIQDAPVLVLDEPTTALDPVAAHDVRAIVKQVRAEGRTILYTTHVMSEAEALCDRVAIVDRGVVLAQGTVAELKRAVRKEEVIRIVGSIPETAGAAIQGLPGVVRAAFTKANGTSSLTVVVEGGTRAVVGDLLATLSAHRATLHHVSEQELTLEDVFFAHTGRSGERERRDGA